MNLVSGFPSLVASAYSPSKANAYPVITKQTNPIDKRFIVTPI